MRKETFLTFASRLFKQYRHYRSDAFPVRRFTPGKLHRVIDALANDSRGLIVIREVGKSFQGRPLRLVTVGNGKTSVLLWSQMHGDESTATMAILDVLSYFSKAKDAPPARRILSSLTLHFLPMLNPDGAACFQRRTAQGIDMNRDALALRTPEARILKSLQRKLRPHFGLNLHDQELSTVANSKQLTALGLLAPAFDAKRSDNPVRKQAKYLAASLVAAMHCVGQRRLAKYDDTFDPRAFGENMQKCGTSTVLIESGHTINDPEKHSVRRLNAVGILAGLYALATEQYKHANVSLYENLPFNGKKAYDLIIRNILVQHGKNKTTLADLGISYQVDTHTESTPVLVDLGDLRSFIGLREIDGKRARLPGIKLILGKPFSFKRW
ncbi:MAG: M14 family zinc carboxypeptidase [Bacteroidota bacterium]|jgi:hypothetical protein